jgi:predicted AAA+ superfamily ATPase
MEAIKRLSLEAGPREVYYFRSHDGLEVDLLIRDGIQTDAFEIKSTQSISPEDLGNLKALSRLMPLRRTAVLSLQRTPSKNAPIEILPWTDAVLDESKTP